MIGRNVSSKKMEQSCTAELVFRTYRSWKAKK